MKKTISLTLVICMLFAITGCGTSKKPAESSSYTPIIVEAKSKVEDKVENNKNLFSDDDAYWQTVVKGDNVETHKFEQEKEFNIIRFAEEGAKVDNVKVEAMINGEFKEIYNQDEMGARAGVVDTVKTNEVRVTITTEKFNVKIKSITFEKVEAIERETPFRVASYITAPFQEGTLKSFDGKLKVTTDAIIIGFFTWDEFGNLNRKSNEKPDDKKVDMLDKNTKELKEALKKEKSTAGIWLCVGSFSGDKNNKDLAFSTPEIRANFIKQTVELAKKYDYKGISMDYEYPETKIQWKNFSDLIVELKAALAPLNKQVSLALAAWGIDLSKEAIDAVDQVQIMLYDAFDEKRRHANYAIVPSGISYFTKLGFDKSKLNIGLALYGREMVKDATERWPGYANMAIAHKDVFTKDTNSIDGTYFTGVTMNKDKTFAAIENQCGGIMTWHYACDLPFTDELSIYKGISDIEKLFIK